jgi:uncharacterized low-complexity protein
MIPSVSDLKGRRNPHAERNNQRRESHPRIESKRWLHFQREESGRRRNAIRFEVPNANASIYSAVEWQQRFRRNKVKLGNVKSWGRQYCKKSEGERGEGTCGANKANTSAKIGEGGRYASVLTSSGQNFLALPLSTYQPKPVIQLQDSGEH